MTRECPICEERAYSKEIDRKLVEDEYSYRRSHIEYIIFLCTNCGNIWGVET